MMEEKKIRGVQTRFLNFEVMKNFVTHWRVLWSDPYILNPKLASFFYLIALLKQTQIKEFSFPFFYYSCQAPKKFCLRGISFLWCWGRKNTFKVVTIIKLWHDSQMAAKAFTWRLIWSLGIGTDNICKRESREWTIDSREIVKFCICLRGF